MVLQAETIMRPGRGYILLGEPGAASEPSIDDLEAFAADITALPQGLEILGHTSRENLVAVGRDGGDTTVLGSWEQEQIDEFQAEAPVEFIDVQGHQFDNFNMSLYYGGGDTTTQSRFVVPKVAELPQKSLCIVYLTRGRVVGQFFSLTSVRGQDAMEHAVDAFSTIPIRFTILDHATSPRQVWIGRQFGQPTPTAPAAPTLTALNPATGAEAGGTTVTITGTNFTGATAVTFGATPAASLTVDSGTQVTAVSPAGTGTVDVQVTTPAGTTAVSGASQFIYAP